MVRAGVIEDEAIAAPIKNLRFNQNLPEMLGNVEAVSTVEGIGSSVIPGVKVSQFPFSGVTDRV